MPAAALLPSTLLARSAVAAPRLLAVRPFATSAARAKPLNLPDENPFTQGRRGLPDQALAFAPLTPAEKNRPNELKIAQQGSNQLSLETPNNGAGASAPLRHGACHHRARRLSPIGRLQAWPQTDRPHRALSFSFLRLAEYVLTGLDKIVNWARQGSMWPMTCAPLPSLELAPHGRRIADDSLRPSSPHLQSASPAVPSR